ncbi:hypothetical protein CLPU_3c00280 [Gottschalkia purinilytica]|uniref:Nudix hydrolase domain-containing protein n=1 Tax=Gottschalkia purinilytica TaxID=1503 RepID=A0A0L0WCW3_GOTPU|nr:hypothetical protein [Gottschalkia purinilytica]KNF09250.1 hypothetical protein CLPU_3c00280 [Gottschalkia purinilytica]
MTIKRYIGGVIFKDNKVFIVKDKENKWMLVKNEIRNGFFSCESVLDSFKKRTEIDMELISIAGETSYEFFNFKKIKPPYKQITWYIVEAKNEKYNIKESEIIDAGFYSIDKAIEMIDSNQEKSIITLLYNKYRNIIKEDLILA